MTTETDPGRPCEIAPGRLYSFSEACRLIPSCRAGKHVVLETLHDWRKKKLFQAVARKTGKRSQWFVYGSEIIKLLGGPPPFTGPSPAEQRREHEAALRGLREMGMKV